MRKKSEQISPRQRNSTLSYEGQTAQQGHHLGLPTWRDETWKEVKRLFHDVANTGKIMRYRSYLRVTGVETDPILPGGWIYALMEPLPMRVTPSRTFNESTLEDSAKRTENEN